MYKQSRILGLIPARGGSKGIPRKNIVDLGGKPLIAWTIQHALESNFIDDVIVSTDDEEIAEISRKFGAEVPFMRPHKLASDTSKSSEVVLHSLNELEKYGRKYEYFVLLQPTSPFRRKGVIDEMISKCLDGKLNSFISCEKTSCYLEKAFQAIDGRIFKVVESKATNRQFCTPIYKENGSVYVLDVSIFKNNLDFTPEGTSFFEMFGSENIDIDTEYDLKKARLLI
jgi:CMP-N,N'-diacetyllegionaminic acid synthase